MNTAGQEDARERRPRPVIADGKETFFLTAGRRACIGRHRPTTPPLERTPPGCPYGTYRWPCDGGFQQICIWGDSPRGMGSPSFCQQDF